MSTVLAHILRSKRLLIYYCGVRERRSGFSVPCGYQGAHGQAPRVVGALHTTILSAPLDFTFLFLLQMTLFAESELGDVALERPVASLPSPAPDSSQSRPPVLGGRFLG